MDVKLYMVLLGCKPRGRHTEQHDLYFGIGHSLKDLFPGIRSFWRDGGVLHIDGWREVTTVDGYRIEVVPRQNAETGMAGMKDQLFFINLGGYKENEFEEFHYKMLTVAPSKDQAIKNARATAFFRHTGMPDAPSHVDDKYGIDVDDLFMVNEILDDSLKEKFTIKISRKHDPGSDQLHLGYLPFM